MKIRLSRHGRFVFLATLAAVCAFRACAAGGLGQPPGQQPQRAGTRAPARPRHEAERVVNGGTWTSKPSAAMLSTGGLPPRPGRWRLPVGYVQVSVGATGYYYYNGVYFPAHDRRLPNVVAPPVGVIVPQLPEGAEALVVGPTTYYCAGGAFYLQQPAGFAVVPAPLGVTVTGLPPAAAPVVDQWRGLSMWLAPVITCRRCRPGSRFTSLPVHELPLRRFLASELLSKSVKCCQQTRSRGL